MPQDTTNYKIKTRSELEKLVLEFIEENKDTEGLFVVHFLVKEEYENG